MSEETTRNEEREELVGAYVDNELTPQLRAQVEQWLTESADLRRLRDELLAMRTGMQQLPRHTLDRDLSASVLERAERAMLAGRQQAVETRDRSVGSSAAELRSSRRSLRMILWPALAVAAALAIAFFDTQQKPAERQVAERAPRGETKIQSAPADGRLDKEANESAGAAAATSSRSDKLQMGGTLAESTDKPSSSAVGSAAKSVPSLRSDFPSSPAATPPGEASEAREGARRAERDMAAAAVLADADDTLVEVEVPPVVIQEQRLQKLLSSNSISWKPVDEEAALPQARSRMVQQEKNKRSNVADVQYFSVSATPEQVDELVNALKKQDSRVSRAQNVLSKDQSLQQQRKVEAAKLPRQAQVNDAKNPAPVTILLRSIDEPEKPDENK